MLVYIHYITGSGSDIEFVNLEDLIEQPGQLMNRSDRYVVVYVCICFFMYICWYVCV